MANAVRNLWRLARAGWTLARHDALLLPEQIAQLPFPARAVLKIAKLGAKPDLSSTANSRLAIGLAALGPSYIKLGQFLSTRPDVIGAKRAFELKSLQDRLPPFAMVEAKRNIATEMGQPVEQLFARLKHQTAKQLPLKFYAQMWSNDLPLILIVLDLRRA
jgi:ubiquinone biosynthesis protein